METTIYIKVTLEHPVALEMDQVSKMTNLMITAFAAELKIKSLIISDLNPSAHPLYLIGDWENNKITFFYYCNNKYNRVDCEWDSNLIEYLRSQDHVPFETVKEALKIAYPDKTV